MSFVMKIMVSLDIVSFATQIVSIIILNEVFASRTEEFFEKILRITFFVFVGSLIGTSLAWIWGL